MLGRHRVPLRREHEIDGVSGRIDSPIQISPLAGDANVSLVDARNDWAGAYLFECACAGLGHARSTQRAIVE
jgi:hypothetical protein